MKNNVTFKDCTRTPEQRLLFIQEVFCGKGSGGWQENYTPRLITRKMIDKVDSLKDKDILVLFNLELLEELFCRHVDMARVSFVTDDKREGMFAKMYGVTVLGRPVKNVKDIKERLKGMKFDIAFTNPPYNRGVDLKILTEVLPSAKEVVCIHPSTWLLDMKGSKTYAGFRERVDGKLKSVDLFNGNEIFSITLNAPLVISHFHKNSHTCCNVVFFNIRYDVATLREITKFGKDTPAILGFLSKMKNICLLESSVWDHSITPPHSRGHYCQLPRIRGNVASDPRQFLNDDFYTTVMADTNKNKVLRKVGVSKHGNKSPTFKFNTDLECSNFIEYLKTDFARFCLALYKNNTCLNSGELGNIPWLDFTQTWDDKKLYKKFNVSKELQDYITEFLPDYYNIRGDKKDV